MIHAEPINCRHPNHPGLLPGLLLAAALGFADGQTWPLDSAPTGIEQPAPEDWHGNVRRSHWAE